MDPEEFALISALNHGEEWVSQMAVTAAPCGYCRQLLAEAFCTFHPDRVWRQLTMKALECATRSHSPYSNSPAGVALRLPVWDSGSDNRRAEEGGEGGEGRTGPGPGQWKIVGGSYYENCAFNPSTSPVKAALVAAVCSQLALDSISHAVLVQLEGAAISHAASTSALIASTSPTCAVRVVYARAPV